MRTSLIALTLVGSSMLGACATLVPRYQPGSELMGRSVRMVTAGGQASALQFAPDGTVRALFNERSLTGRWGIQNDQLCFQWGAAPRECWPYATPLRRGETRSITSDRNNRVEVTLQ